MFVISYVYENKLILSSQEYMKNHESTWNNYH